MTLGISAHPTITVPPSTLLQNASQCATRPRLPMAHSIGTSCARSLIRIKPLYRPVRQCACEAAKRHFSRDLSFVIFGLATMYKTINAEDYRKRLARFCDILIEFEVPFRGSAGSLASGFLMRMDRPALPLSTATAALLALTQASRYLDDARLVQTIDRGLAGFSVESCSLTAGSPSRIDTVSAHMIDHLAPALPRTPSGTLKPA